MRMGIEKVKWEDTLDRPIEIENNRGNNRKVYEQISLKIHEINGDRRSRCLRAEEVEREEEEEIFLHSCLLKMNVQTTAAKTVTGNNEKVGITKIIAIT